MTISKLSRFRYGRSVVIASMVSAIRMIRDASGIVALVIPSG